MKISDFAMNITGICKINSLKTISYALNLTNSSLMFIDKFIIFTQKWYNVLKYLLNLHKSHAATILPY